MMGGLSAPITDENPAKQTLTENGLNHALADFSSCLKGTV
jgi:hypothetical protein